VKNRPLGTQAAPVCEGGVLAPVRLMTADCLRWRSAVRMGPCGIAFCNGRRRNAAGAHGDTVRSTRAV